MNEYSTKTTMLPGTRNIEVLMKQKEVTVGDDLRIQSWYVQDEQQKPFLVQVIGDDADLAEGGFYTCVMRERVQTRESDGRQFTEIQIAAASAG